MNFKRFFQFFSLIITITLFQSSCSNSLFINYYHCHLNQKNIERCLPGDNKLFYKISNSQNEFSDTGIFDFLIIRGPNSDSTRCNNDTITKGYNYFAIELSSNTLCELILLEPLQTGSQKIVKARKINYNIPICVFPIYYTFPYLRDADTYSYLYNYPLNSYFIQVIE